MNFQHLEYFNELAETQYMAQAAEKLGISQPTLSYAVKFGVKVLFWSLVV
ncbi:hypothetical protein ME793_18900 [Lactobacillus delbrueckii]|nr:hypothetical protein ME793_18900 [Lactobacillus delbrueckii]